MPLARTLKPFFAIIFFLSASKISYQSTAVVYSDYRISPKQSRDSNITVLLRPYTDCLNKTINECGNGTGCIEDSGSVLNARPVKNQAKKINRIARAKFCDPIVDATEYHIN